MENVGTNKRAIMDKRESEDFSVKRVCPVCGGGKNEAIQRIRMTLPENIPLPDQYDIVSCARCGFCYADTSAAKEDYDVYYSSYNNYSEEKLSKSFEICMDRIQEMLEPRLDPMSRMVDIGFGNGSLLLRLRELGYQNLVGLDPSQDTVEHGKALGIMAFQRSVYDDPGCLKESFDVGFLTSVMEHLLHPKIGLQIARSYLRENGYLIVVIPDYSMCDHVNFPIPNQFNQEHINYFSDISFSNLLYGTGLRVVDFQSVPLEEEGDLKSQEYACLFLLQKCSPDSSAVVSKLERDTKTKAHIERYLSQRELQNQEMARKIEALYTGKTPLVVWGTGAFTMSLLASTVLGKCGIVAFADGNRLKAGTQVHGMPVIPPEEIRRYPDAAILICAMMHGREIKEKIAELGLSNRVVTLI